MTPDAHDARVLGDLARLLGTTPERAADELRANGVSIDPDRPDARALLQRLGRAAWVKDAWPD